MQNSNNLFIHGKQAFSLKSIEKRAKELGFKNLNKFEIFLWDLEIYCQIQNILKDKVVLKGGLASQMYIPIDYQRTSIDIDMITTASKKEIEESLEQIKINFSTEGKVLDYKQHKPENPKTKLPLLTYYLEFPSKTSENIYSKDEIKLEFIFDEKLPKSHLRKMPELFAIKKTLDYKILPINILLADKLTTLGPNTVGIPESRNDEQPKQIYDIYHLMKFNIEKVTFEEIFENYCEFTEKETKIRRKKIAFNTISKDVETQLEGIIKIEKNSLKWKTILDFQSLYLTKKINYTKQNWEIIGLTLKFFYKLLIMKKDIKLIKKAFVIEELLEFNNVSGEKRGEMIRKFKNNFLETYKKDISTDIKLLKGINQKRIFWEIVSENNIDSIYEFVKNILKEY